MVLHGPLDAVEHSSSACGGHPWVQLCQGIDTIASTPRDVLRNVAAVRHILEQIGLVPDSRGATIYGGAADFMIRLNQRSNATLDTIQSDWRNKFGAQTVGLWQDPLQIASALVFLGQSVSIRRYLEVGVWSAWTTVVLSAYASRLLPSPGFSGVASDLDDSHIAHSTRRALRNLNVSFVPRNRLDAFLDLDEAPFDLCFIDASHSYKDVKEDYRHFAPQCRWTMFHDINDATTLKLHKRHGGGVVGFWKQLKAHVSPHRVVEFRVQSAPVNAPAFGIGVLAPAASTGTAEPDGAPVADWPDLSGTVSNASVYLDPGG